MGATASQASTGPVLPLALTGGSSSYTMARCVSSWVRAPTTTLPGGAAVCRRAATFTASGEKATPRERIDVETHEGLARVDAAASLERCAVGAGETLESFDEAQGGPDGALGVVLVHMGHAEDADDGVADELLDDAAVGLDDRAAAVRVLAQQTVDVLRVDAFGHGRVADEVTRERGDGLALLGRGKRRRQPRAAAHAEA